MLIQFECSHQYLRSPPPSYVSAAEYSPLEPKLVLVDSEAQALKPPAKTTQSLSRT